jgi:hypothetical protein
LPLQFCEAPSSIEIWTGSQNTSAAGWVDQSGIDPKRNLLIEAAFSGIEGCPIGAVRLGLVCQSSGLADGSGSLATRDDGSTDCTNLLGRGRSKS